MAKEYIVVTSGIGASNTFEDNKVAKAFAERWANKYPNTTAKIYTLVKIVKGRK